MRILYIDDDHEDRDIFLEAVRSLTHSVEFEYAASCEDALFKLKTLAPPDLIFLDINMPLRNGKECLKIIKTNPLLKRIPVIIYSTSNHQKERDECTRLGAMDYIVKPGNFEFLCEKLRDVVNTLVK
jgi:CheY-like chemotaxis protein